jgi:carbamoyl-phosphate synthase small subunit
MMTDFPALTPPAGATAALVLNTGDVVWGQGIGAEGTVVGEVCFNTSMTGYQEILTDPSYAGQIITFTFPHIGNVGANREDIEASRPAALGLIVRNLPTPPSNHRTEAPLTNWLAQNRLIGIAGVDTRALTQLIRDRGAAPHGALCHSQAGQFDIPALRRLAQEWKGLENTDLTRDVTRATPETWARTIWQLGEGYRIIAENGGPRVVCVDYGVKENILRCLVSAGCSVIAVPATATTAEILAHSPDGVFLSNGPGDPAATGEFALPVIRELLNTNIPMFGICLGFQLLGLAMGAKTSKMPLGHRGANHPVKDLETGKVEITSQNHGFHVLKETLPGNAIPTHVSLFDGTLQGFRRTDVPVFAVQYHPEASPGPQDSHYLFQRFVVSMGG